MNRWRAVAQRLQPYTWLLVLVSAPGVWFITPARVGWLLVLPLVWGVRWLAAGRPARPTPLDGATAGLALLAGLSLWVTPDVPFTLVKVAGVWLGVTLFYQLTDWIGERKERLGWALAGLLLLTSGLAVVGLLAGRPAVSKWPVGAWLTAHGPIQLVQLTGVDAGVNPNEVAGVVLWVAPLWLAVMAAVWHRGPAGWGRWRWRVALAATLGGGLATAGILLVTQSRSGLVGYAVGLMALAWLGPRHWRWRLLGLGLLAAALVGGVVSGLVAGAPWAEAVGGELAPLDWLSSRPEIWARALYALEDFPLTGLGMNMFRRLGPVFYPYFRLSNEIDLAHAHNQWLQAGVDLGLPGVVVFMALWWGAGLMTAQAYAQARTSADRWLIAGLAACLVASFVFGLTDAIALGARPGVMWWWLLAVGVGAAGRGSESAN